MQFIRYRTDGVGYWGVRQSNTVHSIAEAAIRSPSLQDLTNESYRSHVQTLVDEDVLLTLPVEEVHLLAPVSEPGRIVCVGMNYRVQDEPIPEKPLLFGKAPTAVTHPGAPIRCLREIEEVDYEVELAYRYRPGSLLC